MNRTEKLVANREAVRRYRARNKAKIDKYNREWIKANPDKRAKQQAKTYKRHKKKINSKRKKTYSQGRYGKLWEAHRAFLELEQKLNIRRNHK
jgi:hypothetical protein